MNGGVGKSATDLPGQRVECVGYYLLWLRSRLASIWMDRIRNEYRETTPIKQFREQFQRVGVT